MSQFLFRVSALSAVLGLGLGVASPVASAGEILKGTLGFEVARTPQIADVGNASADQKDLEFSASSIARLDFRAKLDSGDQIRLSQWVEAEAFPSDSELDRLRAETRAGYWSNLAKDTQLRVEAANSYVRDHEATVFVRPRLGAQIRVRHDPQNLSRARLRLGYRNQNEATFEGFDQGELRVELGHDWRAEDRKLRLAGTLIGELRAAEDNKFSYGEVGLQVAAKYSLADDLTVSGKIAGFYRAYGDDFSAAIAERREDLRLRAEARLDYALTDHTKLRGSIGWDQNNSTIGSRSYSGITIGIGVEFSDVFWSSE
ncbi:MAG: hypothetical protein AAFV19_08065 [Pseudomonadota bacterium]